MMVNSSSDVSKRIAGRKLQRNKRKTSKRQFNKARKDITKENVIEKETRKAEKEFSEAAHFLDAEEAYLSIMKLLRLFVKGHELLREMLFIANTQELKGIDLLSELRTQLESYKAKQATQSTEIDELIRKTHDSINSVQRVINEEKHLARQLYSDRQTWANRTLLTDEALHHSIRKRIKRTKKESTRIKKLSRQVQQALDHLRDENQESVKKQLRKLNKYVTKEEKELEKEVRNLSLIERSLIILEFRNSIESIRKSILFLHKEKFKKRLLEKVDEQFLLAQEELERLHRREKLESKALNAYVGERN